jgi:hypothetical protein
MRVQGIPYQINWKAFKLGTSFFIPCLDTRAAEEEISFVVNRLQMDVVIKVVIEDGVQGVRVWRV